MAGTKTPHTNSPRVHVEHFRIAQGNSLTHREPPNGKSEFQKCIYTQMQLEQICPWLSPLFVLSMDFWLDSSCFMLDFQLLNRRTNGNAALASSSSASTLLHPQRSFTEILAFLSGWPEFPHSALGTHYNKASPLYLTEYKGKMLRSYGRHSSLLGSSFSCSNYSLAGKKTESWPEMWMIACVCIYVLC